VPQTKKDATMSFVRKAARAYDPDPAHNERVTTLALALFDGLGALHGFGPKERRLLEISGRLHDIGWSRVVTGKHHKRSRAMIQELAIPGIDRPDRSLCALVARYHTKALPDASRHRKFASLDSRRRELIEWLAGILRIADALDCTHAGTLRELTCEVDDKSITLHLEVTGDFWMELERARQKQDLLVRKAGREVVYRCECRERREHFAAGAQGFCHG
jgi:exopolyphosphatase/guanosine-5'-triphosphate,3'-diphosphate pyrophosphatase